MDSPPPGAPPRRGRGGPAKAGELDEPGRPEPDWNRSHRRLLAHLAADGTLTGPANRTGGETDPPFRPGRWLCRQDEAGADGKPTEQQIALLDAPRGQAAETVVG
ncbi:helicase associated domain-containing protein [Kitasatospora sp. NPDC056138]|uniref:helicase associated domain-containing protein n=1 Tax=Kitasatospora sp. NPDC056138 TaxID=3345724 RepID=UPI0035DA639A